MSWIESHATLRDHPKRKRLSRALGLDMYGTVGLLNCLWWWAMDYAPDGDLARYQPADIADGIDYPGDPNQLVEALRDAGFLDDMQIHDWGEYGEKLYRRRQANAERMRQTRAQKTPAVSEETTRAKQVQRTCSARAAHVQSERTGQDRQKPSRACAREEAVENSVGKELATWSREHVPGWKERKDDSAFFAGLMPPWSELQVRTALKSVADQAAKKRIADPRGYLRRALERNYPAQPPPRSTVPEPPPPATPEELEEAKRVIAKAAARFRPAEEPDAFADVDFGEEPADVAQAVTA